mgnify:CR=1 FL=1
MDKLTQKSYKQSDRLSRYAPLPFYFHTEDNKHIYGISKWLDTNVSYITHKVLESDTLDSIALMYFGNPDYYWIIANFNRITDCFVKLSDKYDTLKIPSLTTLRFVEER